MGFEPDQIMTSVGDKDQLELSYRLHYREGYAAICTDHAF